MIEVGIIGYGFVGQALAQIAVKEKIKVIPFDLYEERFAGPQQMLAAFNCDFVFVCVPTPTDPEDGMIDVSIVLDAACKWNEFNQNPESVLVIKSTVPPGTTDEIIEYLDNDRIVHNPEFLNQATAMEDFMKLDEIVLGGKEEYCNKVLELYKKWVFAHPIRKSKLRFEDGGYTVYGEPRYCVTDSVTAELTKTVRNAFYATKISFMNDVKELCDKMKIDYDGFREVFAHSGKQSWVNPQHTKVPGPDGKSGFAGKCLPKDAVGLAALADTYDVEMSILKAANKSNERRRPEAYGDVNETEEADDL
jgi:UDPglucose 6-dehydrogenase